jgi:dethiobiotin synthetase
VLEQLSAAMSGAQYAFIEGVGGFNIPLTADWTTADLAVDLNCPVILVVGLRLGCVNHAVLTQEAIQSRGLTLAGWVANEVDPDFTFVDENIESLQDYLNVPCLGRVPFMSERSSPIEAEIFQLEHLLLR